MTSWMISGNTHCITSSDLLLAAGDASYSCISVMRFNHMYGRAQAKVWLRHESQCQALLCHRLTLARCVYGDAAWANLFDQETLSVHECSCL